MVRQSACATAVLEPAGHIICTCFVTAGLIVAFLFATDGLDSTESAARALGVDADDIESVKNAVQKALKATTAAGIAVAGLAVLLAYFRAWLSVSMIRRRSTIPHRSSLAYLCLLLPSLVATWLALAWTVACLAFTAVWMAAALTTDVGSSSVVDSDINGKWLQVRDIYHEIGNLTQVYAAAAPLLPGDVRAMIGPVVLAVSRVAPTEGEACPKYCFDLSSWGIMDDAASCFCDLDRLVQAEPHANEAAIDKLPFAILGFGLAAIGFSWLAMAQAVHASRTFRDRQRAQAGMSEYGSEASCTDPNSSNGYVVKVQGGHTPVDVEGAGAAGETVSALGWGGVSGISGNPPGENSSGGGGHGNGRTSRSDPAPGREGEGGGRSSGPGSNTNQNDSTRQHDDPLPPYPPVYGEAAPQTSGTRVRWFNTSR